MNEKREKEISLKYYYLMIMINWPYNSIYM